MDSPNLLQLLQEKAAAVQVVVQEVSALAEACRHALELTSQQGGAAIAAPGWDPDVLALLQDC